MCPDNLEMCLVNLERVCMIQKCVCMIWKVSRQSKKCPDHLENEAEQHIWTMLMHKILQTYLLRAFVANLKIHAIYALYPESFCDKNLAIRKVFVFCDSGAEVCRRRRMKAGMWISRFCHGRVTRSLGWKFIACYKITGGHTTLIAQNQTLRSHASPLIQRVQHASLAKVVQQLSILPFYNASL